MRLGKAEVQGVAGLLVLCYNAARGEKQCMTMS